MAKIGEGDTRWIVNDRSDGCNVNQWHWEEQDISEYVIDEIKSLFNNYVLHSNDEMSVRITESSDVSGDINIAKRKGKIFCYFDFKIILKFIIEFKNLNVSCEGKLTIPEIDHDTVNENYEVTISFIDRNNASDKADSWLRSEGRQLVRNQFSSYFDKIYKKYNVGVKINSNTIPPKIVTPPVKKEIKVVSEQKNEDKIQWKIKWNCDIEFMWNSFMNEQRVSAINRCPAKVDSKCGGVFEFLSGAITGYFVEVSFPNKIVMQWRLSGWKTGLFSTVVIGLSKDDENVTIMDFGQVGIPNGDIERVKQGWQNNFWEPIKIMFGIRYEYK